MLASSPSPPLQVWALQVCLSHCAPSVHTSLCTPPLAHLSWDLRVCKVRMSLELATPVLQRFPCGCLSSVCAFAVSAWPGQPAPV